MKKLKNDAGDRKMAARLASRAEVLQVEEAGILELENPAQRTYNVTQWELKDNVDLRTAQNSFNLNLDQMGCVAGHSSLLPSHLTLTLSLLVLTMQCTLGLGDICSLLDKRVTLLCWSGRISVL